MKNNKAAREPIATWYDAGCRWNMVFETVEVVAFTDKTVTTRSKDWMGNFREQRSAITSEYHHYYSTFEEAHNALIEECQRKIDAAEKELGEWTANLEKAKALKVTL